MSNMNLIKGKIHMRHSGKWVDPLNVRPDDVTYGDIVNNLSHVNRYTGGTTVPVSVLQHTTAVMRFGVMYCDPTMTEVEQTVFFSGLSNHEYMTLLEYLALHDASEAYLQDLPAPLKALPEFQFYRDAEERATATVMERFGLDWPAPLWIQRQVQYADTAVRSMEIQAVTGIPMSLRSLNISDEEFGLWDVKNLSQHDQVCNYVNVGTIPPHTVRNTYFQTYMDEYYRESKMGRRGHPPYRRQPLCLR